MGKELRFGLAPDWAPAGAADESPTTPTTAATTTKPKLRERWACMSPPICRAGTPPGAYRLTASLGGELRPTIDTGQVNGCRRVPTRPIAGHRPARVVRPRLPAHS